MKIKKVYTKNQEGEMEVVSVEQLPDRIISKPTVEQLQTKTEVLQNQIIEVRQQLEDMNNGQQ